MKIKQLLVVVLLLALTLVLTGCSFLEGMLISEVEKIEYGDFIYNKIEVFNEESENARIIAFSTQEGLQKSEIVFPSEIDGFTVIRIGNVEVDGVFGVEEPENYFKNENSQVKKVFVPAGVDLYIANESWSLFPSPIEKAVLLSVYSELTYIFQGPRAQRIRDGNIYICKTIIIPCGYKENYNELYVANFVESNIQFQLNYKVENVEQLMETKRKELENELISGESQQYMLAKYRHELTHNEGVYWIDHLDEGQNLITIPENPTRDGYTFEGWYLDEECTISADLSTITPNPDGTTLFLYAKWI